MRICVSGPPGAGKTLFSRIFSRIVPSLEHIIGDAYLTDQVDWSHALQSKLTSNTDFIFDHVSSVDISLRSGVIPDICIFLDPEESVLKSNLVSRDSSLDRLWTREKRQKNFTEQITGANRSGAISIEANSVSNAIERTTAYLCGIEKLAPPVHSFVVKVAAACNLDCGYCYMYQGHDQSWKSDPLWMKADTIQAFCSRVLEHVEQNPGLETSVILHGGEPLAQSAESLEQLLSHFKPLRSLGSRVTLGVQTNGTHITRRKLEILDEHALTIGVSCDNPFPNSEFDRRLNHAGASLSKHTIEGIKRVINFPWKNGAFGGVICVVDERLDGRDVYSGFRELGVNGIDFLMTGKTEPEVRWADKQKDVDATPFLKGAFHAWSKDEAHCNIPFFGSIVRMLVGHQWSTDVLGLHPPSILEVSTRGEWQVNHSSNLVDGSSYKTGMLVQDHSVKDVIGSDFWKDALTQRYQFSEECISCKNFDFCGAGFVTHRYKRETGYRNRSSRCVELYSLIELARSTLSDLGISQD